MHEAQLHKRTSFITLTYNNKYLPTASPRRVEDYAAACSAIAHGLPLLTREDAHARDAHARLKDEDAASLSKSDLRAFTKRLNEAARRRFGEGIKYYACGEYGENTNRPHYHIAVYGEDFSDDRIHWKRAQSGHDLYRSSRLARLWPWGHADIGELTFESAAYIARYIMKKITGTKAEDHYKRVDREGKEYWLAPEFNVMSRRPGIGKEWFLKHNRDVYPSDNVIARGHPSKPPRYYDKLLEQIAPWLHQDMKTARQNAPRNPEDQTPARLEAREIVTLAKLNQNKRSLE